MKRRPLILINKIWRNWMDMPMSIQMNVYWMLIEQFVQRNHPQSIEESPCMRSLLYLSLWSASPFERRLSVTEQGCEKTPWTLLQSTNVKVISIRRTGQSILWLRGRNDNTVPHPGSWNNPLNKSLTRLETSIVMRCDGSVIGSLEECQKSVSIAITTVFLDGIVTSLVSSIFANRPMNSQCK